MMDGASHPGTRTDPWREFVGSRTGPAGRLRSPAGVAEARIEDWLDVVGGPDPRPFAPRAMLPVWTMPGYAATATASRWDGAGGELGRLRAADGLTGILATDLVQEYDRSVTVGESLHAESVVEYVSELRRTAVGPGRFVRFAETYRADGLRRVGTQWMTVLYHRPEPGPAHDAPDPVAERSGCFTLDVTTSFVVASALATRDTDSTAPTRKIDRQPKSGTRTPARIPHSAASTPGRCRCSSSWNRQSSGSAPSTPAAW
ncbi:hypothetical protein [Pseudonocardia sp. NPDC049154]|uniref:hypothetical protein n=1 Tax=Pseudonocardia sp. NPDC049154 TaxID=3155501 RepID=UPI0033C89671